MTPEQRYLFDITGYLHIEGAVTGEDLKKAQEAAARCLPDGDTDERPPGLTPRSEEIPVEEFKSRPLLRYRNGFSFDKSLEAIIMNPAIWPLVKELTADMPRFVSGTLSSCLLYTSPSPRDLSTSRMPSSA